MTCNAVIATRSGLHLRCILQDGHDGNCMPQLPDCVPQRRPPPAAEASEASFLGHLLNIVEAAIATPTSAALFTPAEAIRMARSLIWQRVGRAEPF